MRIPHFNFQEEDVEVVRDSLYKQEALEEDMETSGNLIENSES